MRVFLGSSLALLLAVTLSWAAEQPGSGQGAGRPGAGKPGVGAPGAGKAGIGRPGAGRPNFAGSAAGRPDFAGPLARVIDLADADKDGKVTLDELQKAMERLPGNRAAGANLDKLFQRLDANGDGALSADEIKSMAGRRPGGKPSDSGDRGGKPQPKGKNKPDKS